MTQQDQQRIFDLLRQAFPQGEPIPVSHAQEVLKAQGIDCLALGYLTFRNLFADMPELVELRQRPDSPLLYDLVLVPTSGAAPAQEDTPEGEPEPARQSETDQAPAAQDAPEDVPASAFPAAREDAPKENQPAPEEGRCVLSEEEKKGLYRVLWEHYPLHFDVPFTDAAPLAARFGYTPQRFFEGEGAPKAYHLFEALAPWARVERQPSGVCYLVLLEAPEEVLASTQSLTGKRAGLTEQDRARICRCLAQTFVVNTPIPLTDLGNALVEGGIDFRALGFSRTPRLLPCLMEDLDQVTADPRHTGRPEVCVKLKDSILRYLDPETPAPSEPPAPPADLEEDKPAIFALLAQRFAPGARVPMAGIFSLLSQQGYGARRYGLKGTDMLDRLGLPYEKVVSPDHPDNPDYLVTLPGAPAPAAPETSQPEPAEPSEVQAASAEAEAQRPEPPATSERIPAPLKAREAALTQAGAVNGPVSSPVARAAGHPGAPVPPNQWTGQVYFHPKTQAILAGFLGLSALDQSHLSQIARDYDTALAAGQVKWVANKYCYSIPLSLRTPEGRATFLSIKVNDYPGGAPWRVNFVGYERPEHRSEVQAAWAPVSLAGQDRPAAPALDSAPMERGPEASAAEITGPVFTRLSDRDKLEIYDTLLPLYPVGISAPLSEAGVSLAHHGITPQRFGYARVLQLFSDMPEYIRISTLEGQGEGPVAYAITLLPLPRGGETPAPVQDQASGDQPPFAMTERTIAFPLSQQGYLSRYINDPEGTEALTQEQINEFQTSYTSAVSAGELVFDPAYQCYKFPLSLVARDGRALRATIKRSDRPVPPAWYVSFIEKCPDQGVRPGDKLKRFAHLGNIQEFLASLAAHAEAEPWGFGDGEEQDYSILWNYITYTFYRLDYEGKVYVDPNGEFAGFNTGLLSRRFGEDLLAYFEPYTGPGGMKWKFVCFCSSTNEARTGTERRAVTLLVPLNLELPRYFSNYYDTLFDPNTRLESNFMHIVRDNLARFPLDWLHKQCDDHQRTKALLADIEAELARCRDLKKLFGAASPEVAASRHQQKQLFQALGEAITDETDDAMCDLLMDMKDLFEGAVGRTLDRCRRNFKLAVPCYFPTRNVMSMLLPISFSRAKNGAPCMALVAERQKNGIYLGRTILTMRMAYNDARLLCRPSSEWLNTASLSEDNGLGDSLEAGGED